MKIEHVAMYVNDLEGARNFFETYFGAVSKSTGADRVYPSGILRRQQRGGGQPDRAADAGRL